MLRYVQNSFDASKALSVSVAAIVGAGVGLTFLLIGFVTALLILLGAVLSYRMIGRYAVAPFVAGATVGLLVPFLIAEL